MGRGVIDFASGNSLCRPVQWLATLLVHMKYEDFTIKIRYLSSILSFSGLNVCQQQDNGGILCGKRPFVLFLKFKFHP